MSIPKKYDKILLSKEELIVAKQYDKQFKLDALKYYEQHKELGLIALKKELQDTKDALEILKKAISILGD